MAGRESSGNPFGRQGGREERSLDYARDDRKRGKADPSPPFPPTLRDWVRDDKRIAGGVRPISPKESRKLEKAIRKKNEKLRSKYRAVHGKVVDWVDHCVEDGYLFVSIRFQDKTDFSLQFGSKMVTDEIDLCDVRSGNFRLLRQYFRRRED